MQKSVAKPRLRFRKGGGFRTDTCQVAQTSVHSRQTPHLEKYSIGSSTRKREDRPRDSSRRAIRDRRYSVVREQQLTKPRARSCEAGHYGSCGTVQKTGDLFIGRIFEFTQQDDFAKLRGKLLDRPSHLFPFHLA